MLAGLDHTLANRWQRDFPLAARPFAAIAARLGRREPEVIERYARLRAERVIDRIAPVFRPHALGTSSLMAMAVPPARLDAVAAIVSAAPGVNHNYEREHRYNLWFVQTAIDAGALEAAVAALERSTGLPALRLPLLEEFHIDLGFDLVDSTAARGSAAASDGILEEEQRRLARRLAGGFPLVPQPYGAFDVPARVVIRSLGAWLERGIVRRVGTVVRHRRLGFRANAMVVWDVPDAEVGDAGRSLAADPAVSLCYRRARVAPDWPYNLFVMVHGRERDAVCGEIARLGARHGLAHRPGAVLFSRRCFVQRGAWREGRPSHG